MSMLKQNLWLTTAFYCISTTCFAAPPPPPSSYMPVVDKDSFQTVMDFADKVEIL